MAQDYLEHIDSALNGLKNFQRATVDDVYNALFHNGSKKILIADEVGLGKTIVAKGIIAMAFKDFLQVNPKSKKRFNVIYICSNQALAAQNLQKLNFSHDPNSIRNAESRLIFLANKEYENIPKFCISTLTPGTSFRLTGGSGVAKERAIIFALLTNFVSFQNRKNGIQRILSGSSNYENWKSLSNSYYRDRYSLIRMDLFKKFRRLLLKVYIQKKNFPRTSAALNGIENISLWDALKRLSSFIDGNNKYSYNFYSEIIGKLRELLTQLCLEYLDADLYILDEFQRYKELIDKNNLSPATQLAQKVFALENSKILMLSATPFKPYTNSFDIENGEDHFREFKMVLEFLLDEKDQSFWDSFEKNRRAFFNILRQPKEALVDKGNAIKIKKKLESIYKESIYRTERLLVAKEDDILITSTKSTGLKLQAGDILDFIDADQIISQINSLKGKSFQMPIEYCKSSPYPFSFLDNYKVKENLKYHLRDEDVRAILKKHRKPWLNLNDIDKYKAIPFDHHTKEGFPNAKLRLLIEKAVLPHGWKLLWVPPSLPYYSLHGAFDGSNNFSKTIVFSSWLMVPRMISTITSYEAERLTIGNKKAIAEKEKRRYFQVKKKDKRIPRPQLVFSVDKSSGAPNNMSNFCLLFPSLTLADLYDPRYNLFDNKSIKEIKKELKQRIIKLFKEHNLKQYQKRTGRSDDWYWAAPVLLDKVIESASKETSAFFNRFYFQYYQSIDPEANYSDSEERKGKDFHKDVLSKCFFNPEDLELGSIPSDLFDVLTDIALGSPAISALRVLKTYSESDSDNQTYAFKIATSFISLFNKPESISVVRIFNQNGPYWRNVLRYSISGNIQSMIDEFFYLLWDCENYKSIYSLVEHFCDVMNIRSVPIKIDDLNSFLNRNDLENLKRDRSMRLHYGLDYGSQKVKSSSGSDRMVNIRQTFNSPFRPFILSTTSIGQEGLDFHYYCKKIVHWNLPSNAIDIEQREGRINRYKGLVIRQNIKEKYLSNLSQSILNSIDLKLWEELFSVAALGEKQYEDCELVPFWHISGKTNHKIERIVPLLPYSKDWPKYHNLLKVLALYRLTFGQPRQEELVEAMINENLTPYEIKKIRSLLMINLSPYANKN